MAINSVGPQQRQPVQTLQTQQPTPFAQRKESPAQSQNSALDALNQALNALEQVLQSFKSSPSANNGQSVAQQAGTSLGQSGASKAPAFDWGSLLGGGSTFDHQAQAAPTPPVQQHQDTSFLGQGGGGGGGAVHLDNGLHLGSERSGGGGTGVRVGSDGANN